MNKVHVKKNDQVVVISGPKDGDKAIKGKQGKILTVDPKAGKVIVEGVAYVTKHQKPRRQGQQGGIFQKDPLGRSAKGAFGSKIALQVVKALRAPVTKALEESTRFNPPASIYELAEYASEILSLCNSMGEGWLLTAEMVELIRTGAPNVVCTQPFACLPNHVVGKAVIKELRRRYPESNIVAVDYDPGASEVNQLNRIKLMIAVAKSNLADKEAEARAARTAAATPAVEEAGKLDVQETRA